MKRHPDSDRRPWYLDPRGRVFRAAAAGVLVVVLLAGLWALTTLLAQVAVVLIPVAIALLLATLFVPVVDALTGRGMPRAAASALVLVCGTALVVALLVFVTRAFITGLPDLQQQLRGSYAQIRDGLTGPLGLRGEQLDGLLAEAQDWIGRNRQQLASGAWGAFSTVGSVLTGAVLALFTLIFFVHDGPRIWRFLLTPLSDRTKEKIDRAGRRAFHDLGSYVRATAAIAAIDAVGIGLGLLIMGVPLVLPLAALVFFGAFLPLIGAFVSGMLAVLVALVTQGPVTALVIAAVVIAVQQLEGNVFEPLLMGNAVKLHPLAVVLAIAVGLDQAGILGALLAVPVLTTCRAVATTQLSTAPSASASDTTQRRSRSDPAHDASRPEDADGTHRPA